MLAKPLASITAEDLKALIGAVQERGDLEYKERLPGLGPNDGPEFLADITSFANTRDGDIIYGVRERRTPEGKPTGVAEALVGVAGNLDAEVLRLENLLRDGVAPRLQTVEMRCIPASPSPVLVIRVRQSWSAPHMVRATGRFHGRNNAGKFALDVDQIREAFSRRSSLTERIRNFRTQRVLALKSGTAPVTFPETFFTVLHLLPLSMFDHSSAVDVTPIVSDPGRLRPLRASSWNYRMSLDGIVAFTGSSRNPPLSYTLVFRSGAVEASHVSLVSAGTDYPFFTPSGLEPTVLAGVREYLTLLRGLGVRGPVVASLSLVGVKGMRVVLRESYNEPDFQGADRDDLLLPEILFDEAEQPVEVALKPMFDSLWQSVGWTCSLNYDKAGKWKPLV
ncbi:MAG: ATP-binding protein [Planctomycetes bacterium]|nr:ATP-binding protein [Planctomycetota bacterium]